MNISSVALTKSSGVSARLTSQFAQKAKIAARRVMSVVRGKSAPIELGVYRCF
jgi:hypothetical protein